jgi:hypothetical protein
MVSLIEIFSSGMYLSGDDCQCQFVLAFLNEDPVEEQLLKHVVLAKAYNTQHHLFKAFFHGNLDKLCTTGRKARYYLNIFMDIIPLLSDLKTMTRFEIKARLPQGTYVDNHPELEHDFQYVWDAIIAMWEGLEWIHLPVEHIQRSMERVIEFARSTQVPKRFRCFNVDHGKKLDEDAKNFAAMTFSSLGYVSKRSNAAFIHTYDREPNPPHPVPYPIDWFVYCAWCHHFASKDPNGKDLRLYLDDEYLKLYRKGRLISPIRQEGENIMMRLTLCEWLERAEDEDNFYYDFRLFGGYTFSLSGGSYALFENMKDGRRLFIKETHAGNPLSPEDGGYPDEVNQYDPNSHGTDEDEIEEIIRTKSIKRDRLGTWRAKFRLGGKAAGGASKRAVARRILQLASPPVEDERYVDWRETLKDKPADEQEEEEDGIGSYGNYDLHVLPHADDTETNNNLNQSVNQSVNQRTSNIINQQAHLPDETIIRDNDLEVNEILKSVEFSPMKGKGKGEWRARFLRRNGIATTGKTKMDVAKNIVRKGKIINRTTGEADVRYVEWRKYIKTHNFPHRHTSPTLGMVESVEEDVVGVEGEGESDNDTSLGDETMHDGEVYICDDDDTKVESILL